MATEPEVVRQSDLLQLVLDRNTMEELGRGCAVDASSSTSGVGFYL